MCQPLSVMAPKATRHITDYFQQHNDQHGVFFSVHHMLVKKRKKFQHCYILPAQMFVCFFIISACLKKIQNIVVNQKNALLANKITLNTIYV